jgi:hypothetical protein
MEELFLFTVIIQLERDGRDSLKDYWSREEQDYTPFYSNVRCITASFTFSESSAFKTMMILQTEIILIMIGFGIYGRFLTF